MKLNKIFIGSVALNLLLAAVLLRPKSEKPAPALAPEVQQPVASRRPVTTRPTLAPMPSSFHWSQLESSDFQQYMANLRGIGCPEETVRDLVLAEVNKLYAPKFAALM